MNVREEEEEEEEEVVNMMCGTSRIYCDSHSRGSEVHDGF